MSIEDPTPVWQTVGGLLAASDLDSVIRKLKAGLAIALPTETVYGVAVDAFNEVALERLVELKGRGTEKRFAVQVAAMEQMEPYLELPLPPAAERLMKRFSPGPLTVLLRARIQLPELIGTSVIGLRIPDHPTALQVLRSFGGPLAVSSANISGQPAAISVEQVLAQLGRNLGGVIDGGKCTLKVASTVVDLTQSPAQVVREGAIPAEQIMAVCREEEEIG